MCLIKLKVIRSGQMTSIQDGGRTGYRSFGIPQSGFMDELSAQQANFLVGNPSKGPVIEMIQVGASVAFESSAVIALTGADMDATLNGTPVERFKTIVVNKGDLLELGRAVSNMITYLAIRGDWNIPEVLGSTSTFLRAKIGGLNGRLLRKGDVIQIENKGLVERQIIPEHNIRSFPSGRKIRLLKSAETTDAVASWLEENTFTVSSQWDRMGIRLISPAPSNSSPQILTSAVAVGTMQLPPDGQPIIVMADGQTTGGYPRIATVIKADLPYLAQQPPGTLLNFTLLNTTQALNLNAWTYNT